VAEKENKKNKMGIFNRIAARTRTIGAASPALSVLFGGGMVLLTLTTGPLFPLVGTAMVIGGLATGATALAVDIVNGTHATKEINRQNVVGKRAYISEFKDTQSDVFRLERLIKKAKTEDRREKLQKRLNRSIAYCEKLADKLVVVNDMVEPENGKLRVLKSKDERKKLYKRKIVSRFDIRTLAKTKLTDEPDVTATQPTQSAPTV
tara:strand:- start:113 stop:730 length:618 start_codon:yes stop_codon:yes gene_type:complete